MDVGALSVLLGFFGLSAAQPSATVSAWEGVYTEEQAARGEGIYARECGACHGAAMEGAEAAPGLADGTFQANWNGLTLGDLFDRVRDSMPPDDPGKLSRDQLASVLATVLRANRFPAGERELANRSETLRRILFDPYSR